MACKDTKVLLSSGYYMPQIGLGTYLIRGKDVSEIVDRAFTVGYRLIDTAALYGNETELGNALKVLLPKHKLERRDIFITSKLCPSLQGERALSALHESFDRLNSDYIDLYLVHWPGTSGVPPNSPKNAELRSQSWQCLTEGVKKGWVKSIGVSNYTVKHLKELLDNDYGIKPVVNQVEWHPYCHDEELKKYCVEHNIHLQAYTPLGGSRNRELMNDPVVVEIAKKIDRSPAQVLLQWLLQQNIAVIPKSTSQNHLIQNMDLNFTIPYDCMEKLCNMKKSKKYTWDPNTIA